MKEDKEILEALSGEKGIEIEDVNEEVSSPLNQPVIDRSELHKANATDTTEETNEPMDAPTQQFSEATEAKVDEDYVDPKALEENAAMLADSILGGANMMIGVGGGYFVKIRKDEDFYQFEEVIELIDEQNEKNVHRIKLDEEDIALLRPLLIVVLKKRVAKVTPEKQLLGAVFAILIKKYQVVQEIKADNEILYGKLVGIIRQEQIAQEPEETEEAPTPPEETISKETLSEEVDMSEDPEDSMMEEAQTDNTN